jgi:membrane protein YqaA with SNARE-associated domain
MGWMQLRSWLKASLPALGGIGLLAASFVDSSFVPLPLVTDLVLIDLSSRHPTRMPYYAGMAAVGSLAGCLWIYYLARKGGQAYYRRTQGHPPGKIRRLIEKYPMACVVLPAVAPFPVPFKPFVVAQGVFQVPPATFIVGTLVGRGTLFFVEGFLGARYGAAAWQFLVNQRWASAGIVIAIILAALLIHRLSLFRRTESSQAD